MSDLLDSDRHAKISAVAYALVKDAIEITGYKNGGEFTIDVDECNRLTMTFLLKSSDDELYGIISQCIMDVEGNRTCLSFSLAHAIYHWLDISSDIVH